MTPPGAYQKRPAATRYYVAPPQVRTNHASDKVSRGLIEKVEKAIRRFDNITSGEERHSKTRQQMFETLVRLSKVFGEPKQAKEGEK